MADTPDRAPTDETPSEQDAYMQQVLAQAQAELQAREGEKEREATLAKPQGYHFLTQVIEAEKADELKLEKFEEGHMQTLQKRQADLLASIKDNPLLSTTQVVSQELRRINKEITEITEANKKEIQLDELTSIYNAAAHISQEILERYGEEESKNEMTLAETVALIEEERSQQRADQETAAEIVRKKNAGKSPNEQEIVPGVHIETIASLKKRVEALGETTDSTVTNYAETILKHLTDFEKYTKMTPKERSRRFADWSEHNQRVAIVRANDEIEKRIPILKYKASEIKRATVEVNHQDYRYNDARPALARHGAEMKRVIEVLKVTPSQYIDHFDFKNTERDYDPENTPRIIEVLETTVLTDLLKQFTTGGREHFDIERLRNSVITVSHGMALASKNCKTPNQRKFLLSPLDIHSTSQQNSRIMRQALAEDNPHTYCKTRTAKCSSAIIELAELKLELRKKPKGLLRSTKDKNIIQQGTDAKAKATEIIRTVPGNETVTLSVVLGGKGNFKADVAAGIEDQIQTFMTEKDFLATLAIAFNHNNSAFTDYAPQLELMSTGENLSENKVLALRRIEKVRSILSILHANRPE